MKPWVHAQKPETLKEKEARLSCVQHSVIQLKGLANLGPENPPESKPHVRLHSGSTQAAGAMGSPLLLTLQLSDFCLSHATKTGGTLAS